MRKIKETITTVGTDGGEIEEVFKTKTVKNCEAEDDGMTITFRDGTEVWINFNDPEFEHYNIGWKAE